MHRAWWFACLSQGGPNRQSPESYLPPLRVMYGYVTQQVQHGIAFGNPCAWRLDLRLCRRQICASVGGGLSDCRLRGSTASGQLLWPEAHAACFLEKIRVEYVPNTYLIAVSRTDRRVNFERCRRGFVTEDGLSCQSLSDVVWTRHVQRSFSVHAT